MEFSYLLGPAFQALDVNGKPLTGGWIEVYVSGTSHTKYITFSDFEGHENPFKVPLNDKGMASIVCDASGLYDVYCYNRNGVEQWAREQVKCVSVQTIEYEGDKVVVEGVAGETDVSSSTVGDNTVYTVGLSDDVKQDILNIESTLGTKKDIVRTGDYTATGAATKTIKKITQNPNGEISVEYQNIDLPPEVPNVEIVSDTLNVSSSTDASTNTKTFTIDLDRTSAQFIHGTSSSIEASSSTQSFNLSVRNSRGSDIAIEDGKIKLKAPGLYLLCATVSMYNTNFDGLYKEVYIYTNYNRTTISYDNSEQRRQTAMISDIYYAPTAGYTMDLSISGFAGLYASVYDFYVVKLEGLNSGGGTIFTAGDGIGISGSEISVNAGDGLGFDNNGKLEVKVGDGLTIDTSGGVKVITVDSDVSDVVEAVQEMQEDMDTKITSNFPPAMIVKSNESVASGTQYSPNNGGMLFGTLFITPFNHNIFNDDSDNEYVTKIGIISYNVPTGYKAIIGIYEYQPDYNNGAGRTVALCDTGIVEIQQGYYEYTVKNVFSNNTDPKLKTSCFYYATVYMTYGSSASVNGWSVACAPGYDTQMNAIKPLLTATNVNKIKASLDSSDATYDADLNFDKMGFSWQYDSYPSGTTYSSQSIVEANGANRIYMVIRNTENTTASADPFTDIGTYSTTQSTVAALGFSTAPTYNTGMLFKEITPATNCNLQEFSWTDTSATAYRAYLLDGTKAVVGGYDGASYNDGTITDVDNGDGTYTHKFTFTTAQAITANATYYLTCCYEVANLTTAITAIDGGTGDSFLLFDSYYNVSQYGTYDSENNTSAKVFLKVKADGTEYVI